MPLPGAEQAVAAAAGRGWEAVFLVILLASAFAFFGWLLRRLIEDGKSREDRLAGRITTLEDTIHGELFAQVRANSEIMARMVSAADRISHAAETMISTLSKFEHMLAARPCLYGMRGQLADTDTAPDATGVDAANHEIPRPVPGAAGAGGGRRAAPTS